jgi:hypothetical protein
MPMRSNVKPLIHWIIYRGYKVRFSRRAAGKVQGVLTKSDEEIAFEYDPVALVVYLPDARITINEYGWELKQEQADAP